MAGPLRDGGRSVIEGIRILSLAEQYPGPYATLLLGDLGADVISVERPKGGDPARAVDPGFFEALNRGRRSVALDLKSDAGREALMTLAGGADVLLEGFRPGVMDRLGVGYEDLRAVNPGLVYVSVSGFGQTGPARDRPAHDLSYQAITGMLYDRAATGEPGEVPPVSYADLTAGTFAALAVLAGLVRRAQTGEGTYVDVSMADGLVSWMTAPLFSVLNGTGRPLLLEQPGYGVFRCADGRLLTLSVAHEDPFWRALCAVTGLDEVAELDQSQREHRRGELSGRLADILAQRPLAEWEQALTEADVPHGPVNSLEEVAADPQVGARELIVELDGRRYVRQPLRFGEGLQTGPRRPAPALGEHTREILEEAGMDEDRIEELLVASAQVGAR